MNRAYDPPRLSVRYLRDNLYYSLRERMHPDVRWRLEELKRELGTIFALANEHEEEVTIILGE